MDDVISSLSDRRASEADASRARNRRDYTFSKMPNDLKRHSRIRRYARGETIICEGDAPAIVGTVMQGVVKVLRTSAQGRQQIVGLLYPSDFFGRPFANLARFSYEAATDASLCAIDRRTFESHLLQCRSLEKSLLLATLDKLDSIRGWQALIAGHTTAQRLAAFLYILSKRGRYDSGSSSDSDVPCQIPFPICRRDLASFISTSPETLSRNLQSLVRAGIIRLVDANSFELVDEKALIACTGECKEDLGNLAGQPTTSEKRSLTIGASYVLLDGLPRCVVDGTLVRDFLDWQNAGLFGLV